MAANLKNSSVATGLEKVSFHSNLKERQSQRMLKPTAQLHSSHMLVMPKILQARLQQYTNHELPDVQARFRKAYIISWRMGLLKLDFNSKQFNRKGIKSG